MFTSIPDRLLPDKRVNAFRHPQRALPPWRNRWWAFLACAFMLLSFQTAQADCASRASFEVSNQSPVMGDHVSFTNTSSNAIGYEWRVDGFTVSTDADYTHYFNGAGTFEVMLVAESEEGCSDEFIEVFNIERLPRSMDHATAHKNYVTSVNEVGTIDEIKIFDRFGNDYTTDDILIPNNSWTAGIFVLHFDDEDDTLGTGFDDNATGTFFPTLGQDRREVVIQAFEDLSALLTNNNVLPSPYTGLNTAVEIRVSTNVGLTGGAMPPGALGVASSYYIDYPNSGISHGAVWKTITTGVDAYHGTTSAPMFHGIMSINLNANWYLDLSGNSGIGSSAYDLYTVVLHEAMHMLGFASGISQNGSSALNNGNYFPYDQFLETGTGSPLVTTVNSCYDHQFSASASALTGGCNAVKFAGNGTNNANQAVHSPTSWAAGSSLSHFNCINGGPCTLAGNGYVMNFCSGIGAIGVQRIPQISEVETLCDLGYNIQNNYGNGDYSASTTTTNPFAGACSNNVVAGVNDYREYIPSQPFTAPLFTVTSDPGNILNIAGIDILGNDLGNPNQINCLEIVYPGGALTGSTPTSIVYDPLDFWSGTAVLRYRPFKSSTNTYGNVTYIYIKVQSAAWPCDPSDCDLACNGDFEIFEDQANCGGSLCQLSSFINDFTLTASANSTDVFNFNNNTFLFMGNHPSNPESIFIPLSQPVGTGCTVDISFDASYVVGSSTGTPAMIFMGANTVPCPIPTNSAGFNGNCGAASVACPAFTPLCPAVTVPITNLASSPAWPGTIGTSNPNFQNYTASFTNSGPPIDGILITPLTLASAGWSGILLDNVEFTNQCVPQFAVTATGPSNPCINTSISIDYQICLPSNVSANFTPINLDVTLPTNQGVSFANGGDFNLSGQAVIPGLALTFSAPCTTLTLHLDVSANAIPGAALPVVLNMSGGCVQDQTLATIDLIPGVPNVLSVSKTAAAGTYTPGSTIPYTITVENNSLTNMITDIEFEDQIPANLTVTGTLPAGLSLNASLLTSSVPFTLGPGQVASYTFNATVNSSMTCGNITNCVSVIEANGACSLPISDCVTTYIHSNDPPPTAFMDATYCEGELMVDLTAVPSSAGSLHWYDGMIGPFPFYLGSGNTLAPPNTAPGTYEYLVCELVGSCLTVPDTVTITIEPGGWQQVASNPTNHIEYGEDVQVDDNGNVYVTGACGLNATFGLPSTPMQVNGPGFIAKYDDCGGLLWIEGLPQPGKALALDATQQNVIVTGGGWDFAILHSYGANGAVNWTEMMHNVVAGSAKTVGTSVDIDANDMIYVTGHYTKIVTFGTQQNAPQLIGLNPQSGFLARYNASGQVQAVANLVPQTSGNGTVHPRGIAVEELGGAVYVGGTYSEAATFGGQLLTGSGEFVSKHLATTLVGTAAVNVSSTYGWAISPLHEVDWNDALGQLYVVGGNTVGSLAPSLNTQNWSLVAPGPQVVLVDLDYEEVLGGLYVAGIEVPTLAVQVASLDAAGSAFYWQTNTTNTGGGVDIAYGVAANGSAPTSGFINVMSTGGFAGGIQFPNSTTHTSNGSNSDVFVARMRDNGSSGSFYKQEASNPAEVQDDRTINIFPNPFRESFSIDLGQFNQEDMLSVEVFDLRGSKVFTSEQIPGGSTVEFSPGPLSQGLYMVKILHNSESYLGRIIKY